MQSASRFLFALIATLFALASPETAVATQAQRVQILELETAVLLVRDKDGLVHVLAREERDLFVAQGFAHARDRLFQMDVTRRQASGTLAELLGDSVLADDVEFRVIGVRRAAERSLAQLDPETLDALEAYTEGVNAFIAGSTPPPEYGFLELTAVEPWTVLDSVTVAKAVAFSGSFDLDDIDRTQTLLAYQAAGQAGGFDGAALFFEDLNRTAPFTSAATVPDSESWGASAAGLRGSRDQPGPSSLRPATRDLARRYLERVEQLPVFGTWLSSGGRQAQSNAWAVSGALTRSRRPILANDPHQDLLTPNTFHPIHLLARNAGFDVIGMSFAGTPFVALGHNRRIAWGGTVNLFDLTDVYEEEVVIDPQSPSGLSTVHLGQREPVIPIPEVFRVNLIGDGVSDNLAIVPPGTGGVPAATLIVPRRNNGPIISLGGVPGTAISIQYVGFSATRELDGIRRLNLARSLDDFKDALQLIDAAAQNFVYADTKGNIAYFVSGEVPLREDLQTGGVTGAPPTLIRDGRGGNEWIGLGGGTQPPDQALPFEILPFEELPQTVNPSAGFVITANNDPLGLTFDNDPLNQLRPGGGIFYLSPIFNFGIRAQRITDLLREGTAARRAAARDMKALQADIVMLDAQVLAPSIIEAFENAKRPAAPPELAGCGSDPGVLEAVDRLRFWDFSAPSGIPEGFDAIEVDGKLEAPGPEEIQASIAAAIYSGWRGQMVRNTIQATADQLGVPSPISQRLLMTALRNLLDTFETQRGVGRSGIDFFALDRIDNRCQAAGGPSPGLSPEARRDIFILSSLVQTLDRFAGSAFENAFANSTDQEDYRWGRLHRTVLPHPLGFPFSINAVDPAFQPFGDILPGVPTDGGYEVVDASSHSSRANEENDFIFDDGPLFRFVAELGRNPGRIRAESSLAGGASGVPNTPFFANLFREWLTNETFPLRQRRLAILLATAEITVLMP